MAVDTRAGIAQTKMATEQAATGTDQASAYPLTTNCRFEFTTVAAGSGVRLPFLDPVTLEPPLITITNSGANDLLVYPPVGGTINLGAVNSPVTVLAGTSATYWASRRTSWYSIQTPVAGITTVPGGTAGALQYNNGSVFGGEPNLLRGADGNLHFNGITHATPAAGDLWYPSSDTGTFSIGRAAGQARLGGCIFSCTLCTTIASVTGPTSVFVSPTGVLGSLTIPANTLAVGNILRWQLCGNWGASASGVTLAFTVIFNGTNVLAATATVISTQLITNVPVYSTQGFLRFNSVGAAAGVFGVQSLQLTNPPVVNLAATSIVGGAAPSGSIAVATNTNALFDIAVTFGTANAANTFRITSFHLFLDN